MNADVEFHTEPVRPFCLRLSRSTIVPLLLRHWANLLVFTKNGHGY